VIISGRLGSRGYNSRNSISEESPSFMEIRYQLMAGWGNPRESAAEIIPPFYYI